MKFLMEFCALCFAHCVAEFSGGYLLPPARGLGRNGAFLACPAVFGPNCWAVALVFDETEGACTGTAVLAVEDVVEVSCCGGDAGAG